MRPAPSESPIVIRGGGICIFPTVPSTASSSCNILIVSFKSSTQKTPPCQWPTSTDYSYLYPRLRTLRRHMPPKRPPMSHTRASSPPSSSSIPLAAPSGSCCDAARPRAHTLLVRVPPSAGCIFSANCPFLVHATLSYHPHDLPPPLSPRGSPPSVSAASVPSSLSVSSCYTSASVSARPRTSPAQILQAHCCQCSCRKGLS